jgi:hypothetical protein
MTRRRKRKLLRVACFCGGVVEFDLPESEPAANEGIAGVHTLPDCAEWRKGKAAWMAKFKRWSARNAPN